VKNRRRSAFVPRVIFGTVFVGVIPACAVSCGGDDSTTGNTQTGAGGQQAMGVAVVGFSGYQNSVAAIGFGGGGSRDASSDAKGGGGAGGIFLGVGAGGFGAVAAGGFGGAGGAVVPDAGQSKDSGADSSG
jgi:hypothetical protein